MKIFILISNRFQYFLLNTSIFLGFTLHKLFPVHNYTVVSPELLQKIVKKCNSPGDFPGLVVFLGVFFRKFVKKSQNVTVRESLL